MPVPDRNNLDLHGLTWPEAKTAFVEFFNQAIRRGGGEGGRFEVIHGYGSSGTGGTLRSNLRKFLTANPTYLEFDTGEFWDGNPGHTFVMPLRPLPSMLSEGGKLEEEVWVYCEAARTHSKISGRFRRHGEPEVARAIKALLKQHRLNVESKGPKTVYRAIGSG